MVPRKDWFESTKLKVLATFAVSLLFWSCQTCLDHGTNNNDTQLNNAPSTRSSPSITKFSAVASERVLNIHMVPHTHDDVGWRKTVEQYYTPGANASIDHRGNVRNILSTTIQSLLDNDARTFSYVESKYFYMWWQEQPDAVKDSVRYLIANQQLIFANGGWCMHDEASTHYMGMIDQTALGHAFLKRELGVVPKIGWQLDPFGHSATQASLLSVDMGFDALYFGRIDYQDLTLRQLTRQCEGFWEAARSPAAYNVSNRIFWGLTGGYRGNYGAPDGFCFDVFCNDEPLVGANATRLMQRVQTFLQSVRIQSDRTIDNHVMLTMGTDFNYMEAHTNFANLDILIGLIMDYQRFGMLDIPSIFGPRYDRLQVFYSNPEYYTQQKFKSLESRKKKKSQLTKRKKTSLSETTSWQVKTDDFFPYSDCEHCFWTGYFTSRATFKRMERVASSFLLAARQVDALARLRNNTHVHDCCCCHSLFPLEDALGIAQHHDAISGTAKQHVADDYNLKVHRGIVTAARHVSHELHEKLLGFNDAIKDWTYCPLLHNESTCHVSTQATMSNETSVYTVVYNSLPRNHSTIVRLPVASRADYVVEELGANQTQVIRSIPASSGVVQDSTKYVLLWKAGPLLPLGAKTFSVTKLADAFEEEEAWSIDKVEPRLGTNSGNSSMVHVTNGLVTVYFDEHTGEMKRIDSNGINMKMDHIFGYYTSFDSTMDRSEVAPSTSLSQNSGAYIFRPSTPTQEIRRFSPTGVSFINTTVGTEAHVTFAEPWIRQVTRVMTGQPFVEVEYTIGPIPINDGRGKEIVTRYSTPIKSNTEFFTDSNGREFQHRRRNFRPSWDLDVFEPMAGNYYPVNSAIYLQDDKAALAVVVDRSQGGASLQDGALELMVQRRTLVDDERGVDEPLNETCGGMTPYPPYGEAVRVGDGVIVRGVHRLMVGAGPVGARLARSVMDIAFAEPLILVGTAPSNAYVSFNCTEFSGLQANLPENVMIITFAHIPGREESTFLLRLGHQYGVNEDEKRSKPVTIDLTNLLVGFQVESFTEMTLSGNQKWKDYQNRRLNWQQGMEARHSSASDGSVTLRPMEIRTFEITVKPMATS